MKTANENQLAKTSAIVKVQEQGGAAKIRTAKVPRFLGKFPSKFPKVSSQVTEGSQKWGSQASFPSNLSKQGFQARFSSKVRKGSHEAPTVEMTWKGVWMQTPLLAGLRAGSR